MYPLLDIDINPDPVDQEQQVKVVARPRWWRDPILLCYGCMMFTGLSAVISGIVIIVQLVQTNPYLHS